MQSIDLQEILPQSLDEYQTLLSGLVTLSEETRLLRFRHLAQVDLYFLMRYILNRRDVENPWIFQRCREVQFNPDGYLDLWSRAHFKSSLITVGLTIQEIINDPEITIGIFSHTRPIAKAFLSQIKREFETNEKLLKCFPDIFYAAPEKQSQRWSLDEGIIVKRKTNPKEGTIEAWGLVDGQPTSKHYKLRIYDDVVTIDSVRTPGMIAKTTEAIELSFNLGVEGGRMRMVGTRYHYQDTYKTLMDRGTVRPRIYPATEDGTPTGKPVLWSKETLDRYRNDLGPFTFASQCLVDPVADEKHNFSRDWLRFYSDVKGGKDLNKYIFVDPANEKKRGSDYTAIWVIGIGEDDNYYALDIYRDRLNLVERTKLVFELERKWKPIDIYYEKYGMQVDIEHIQEQQERENYRFSIREVGGNIPKTDRIKKLVPLFMSGRIWLPKKLEKVNYEGKTVDVVQQFINDEYLAFPVGTDDMLDSLARIRDEAVSMVKPGKKSWNKPLKYDNKWIV